MDLGWIEHLVRLMETADLSEVEIDDSAKGIRVHLKRGAEPEAAPATPVVQLQPAGARPAEADPAPAVGAGPAPAPADGGADGGDVPFLSPMVGTFYRAASPESEPFVSVGAHVEDETVVCIIEAMKVMNEIKAETRGQVVRVLVENGEAVEFGQPLFLLRPA